MKSKSSGGRSKNSGATALQKILKAKVPLTKAMGLKVLESSADGGVTFALPLKPNRNHKNTAFGGTLVASQALACWAWICELLLANQIDAEVVVQYQNADFLLPVKDDFKVTAKPTSVAETKRFLKTIARHKKARLRVTACVLLHGRLASRYTGEYVAIRP